MVGPHLRRDATARARARRAPPRAWVPWRSPASGRRRSPSTPTGTPTGPCITWQDTSGGRQVRERVGGRVSGYRGRDVLRWVRRTAGAPSLSGADPIGHILGFRAEHPEAAAATRWYLEPVDFLTMRFCGEATASPASMQGAWLTDVRHLDRLSYDQQLLDAVGLASDQLAPLRPIGSIVGTVTPTSPPRSGSPPTAVVVTGLPDLQAAALGAGATVAVRDAPRPVDDVVGQLPGPEEEDRHLPLDRRRAGAHHRLVPRRQQPGHRREGARVVPGRARRQRRHRVLRRADRARRDRPPGFPRRAVHAVARRRALPGRQPPRARRLQRTSR